MRILRASLKNIVAKAFIQLELNNMFKSTKASTPTRGTPFQDVHTGVSQPGIPLNVNHRKPPKPAKDGKIEKRVVPNAPGPKPKKASWSSGFKSIFKSKKAEKPPTYWQCRKCITKQASYGYKREAWNCQTCGHNYIECKELGTKHAGHSCQAITETEYSDDLEIRMHLLMA